MLVANRGEIARRVIRTLRRLGIRSVAVYSDADADAPHVREADVAVRIGPAAASESYLDIAAVIEAARETGAEAIHPGYGFLSENAGFARACVEAGIVFIGPGERALDVMGDKIRAKEHVVAHGVPTVPGFSAVGMTDADIAVAAEETGYPLLVKPSAGGGGKGMQVVRSAAELPDALATARRVAAAAFGDDTLLLERLLERPRHIEVQVLADAHGSVIHLGERECTLQRRHQKVIEEAPSPVVDAATRARLGAAACAAAESVDYRGAGTVEFLVAGDRPDDFFFIEMNTRLQVEHPVTELVTGVDLVEQQLLVAAGRPLALAQDDIRLDGHAIEARVYAESPARGFLPATGEVLVWREPGSPVTEPASPVTEPASPVTEPASPVTEPASPVTEPVEVRTDAAVESGSVVSSDYDPMIAKVIAHGDDRAQAIERLDAALAETVLLGVESNIGFLRELLADPGVQSGEMDTGLIDRLPPYAAPEPGEAALAAAALAGELARVRAGEPVRTAAGPLWLAGTGWRAGSAPVPRTVAVESEDGGIAVITAPDLGSAPVVSVGSRRTEASGSPGQGRWGTRAIGRALPPGVVVATDGDGWLWVHADGATHRLRPLTRREAMEKRLAARDRDAAATDPELRAPMPGAVVALHVADGAAVAAGDRIVTIEAMKMEHPVIAPHAGVVRLDVATGDQVRRDQVLAHVAAAEPAHEASDTPS
ncbi:acetyl-CoA carboxylase biotin carboxylase subunit [Microbacterium yannicii]|uniref:biotin carboxylase n=1 Tax=Microbacterium yannicii TaxID=671622 RepID=A0ABP9MKD0_9MICO